MKNNTMISIRVNEEMKNQASIVAESAGMTLSSVIKALMKQMAEKKRIPFEIQSTLSDEPTLHMAIDNPNLAHQDLVEYAAKEVISENEEVFNELAK